MENAIPQSVFEEELTKGLLTSSEPPVILAFDRAGATLLLKKFSQVNDVEMGTEYETAPMDFKKAEITLKNSALSYVISADFSPQTSSVTFPDGFIYKFSDVSTLPSLKHTVIDPGKQSAGMQNPAGGTVVITSTPDHARVYIDSQYVGDTPVILSDIMPGQHNLTLERDGCEPAIKTFIVNAGEMTTISLVLLYVTPTPLSGSILPIGMPGFGAVIAGLALAGFAALRMIKR